MGKKVRVELNLDDLPPDFIWIIADKTTDATVLDEIVDYAIENEYKGDSADYVEQFYMDMVCVNPALSRESIMKLIIYDKCEDIHNMIIKRTDIDTELLEMMAKRYKDFSTIVSLFEQKDVSPHIADIVAERIMAGDISFINCRRYEYRSPEYISETLEKAIYIIAGKCSSNSCSNSVSLRLTSWWINAKNKILSEISN